MSGNIEAVLDALHRHHAFFGMPQPKYEVAGSLAAAIGLSSTRPYDSGWYGRHHSGSVIFAQYRDLGQVEHELPAFATKEAYWEAINTPEYYLLVDLPRLCINRSEFPYYAITYVLPRTLAIASPFMREACDSGLGWMTIGADGNDPVLYLVMMPEISMDNGIIHSDNGPAIQWPDGTRHFVLKGVPFSPDVFALLMRHELSVQFFRSMTFDQQVAALTYMLIGDLKAARAVELIDVGVKGTHLYHMRQFSNDGQDAYLMWMKDASTDREFIEWVDPDIGRLGDAELCQAAAFGISLEQWLGTTLEG